MTHGFSKRKSSLRRENRLLVLVCEGSKTEKIYFNQYNKRNSGLSIKIPNCTRRDPTNLIKFALTQIPKYELDLNDGDQIWCVFDSDNNSDTAIQLAKRLANNQINICFSNPCFEIWYLLHFEYYSSKISSKDLMNKLETHIKNYEKNKDYSSILIPKSTIAINNANKLNSKHKGAGTLLLSTKSNPSTQVHTLVEWIAKISKANKK